MVARLFALSLMFFTDSVLRYILYFYSNPSYPYWFLLRYYLLYIVSFICILIIMIKKKKWLCLLFIDTETTWLSSTDQILQFAAIYGVFDGKKFHEKTRINQYMNITTKINFFAQRVHGISKSMVANYWYIDSYIDTFLEYINKSDHIVGHNISFDIRMLQQDCERIERPYDRDTIKTFCTMRDIGHISDLPKKRPRLGLLYTHLFGRAFDNAHDAMADIEATKDCFIELAKRGEISLH